MKVDYNVKESMKDRKIIERPTSGGYVCQLKEVKNNTDLKRLEFEFDIVEGQYKGYAAEMNENFGFCPLHFFQYYSKRSSFYMAQFLSAIDATNLTTFYSEFLDTNSVDETQLIGKGIGLTLQKVLYTTKDGRESSKYKVMGYYSASEIRNNDFEAPTDGDERAAASTFTEESDDGDLPF